VAVVLLATGCGGGAHRKALDQASQLPWWYTAPQVAFGRIGSLTPLGAGYKLRLHLYLRFGPDKTGVQACIDNHDCPAETNSFPDDTYEHDLKYLVTYYVPPAHRSTSSPAAQLNQRSRRATCSNSPMGTTRATLPS
jgi:hypothetical protein